VWGRRMVIRVNGIPFREFVGHTRGGRPVPVHRLMETLRLRERGMSFAEIGEIMGVSRNAAKYRCRRAREREDIWVKRE